jgi:hypothetical protein
MDLSFRARRRVLRRVEESLLLCNHAASAPRLGVEAPDFSRGGAALQRCGRCEAIRGGL